MAMLYINGAAAPSPAEFSVEIEDIGEAKWRNALGERVADRVAVKRSIEVSWLHLSAEKLAQIMSATTQNMFFTAKYFDPATGGLREGVFRAVQKSAELFRVDGSAAIWGRAWMKWEEK